MPELGFQEQSSGYSPDSVIYTLESNFSLFSSTSASASVDRCSFASDTHDRDSFTSEISLHLAEESWSGPDPDPNRQKHNKHKNKHSRLSRKVDNNNLLKAAQKEREDSEADSKDNNLPTASARNSFSLAVKECQERRSRSEALSNKIDRNSRSASLDLNNVTSSSPRLVKKGCSVSTRKSGTFHSPAGTPNYRQASVGMQKGWSSERVPLHANMMRRQQVNGAGFLPLTQGGRTIPSKWEDAERWIFSPVSGDGLVKPSFAAPQSRPKSKSGPLGPPGVAYYSMYSPAMPMFHGEPVGNFMAGSPFSAGVIEADGLKIESGGHGGSFEIRTEPSMARSASVHGCSEVLNPPSLIARENLDGVKDAATDISRTVSRRDMATQMSPDGSARFSPRRRLSFSATTPSILPVVELQSVHPTKPEIRDVQIDERVTMTRWSKKNKSRIPGKSTDIVEDWRNNKDVSGRSSWGVETIKSISNSKREEAKISAWENLQKAKAEAAIRKLEMKLEKKRSSSMERIMNKLRSAQKRAQDMRSSASTNQIAKNNSEKALSLRRTRQMGSLSGCFTCHAF